MSGEVDGVNYVDASREVDEEVAREMIRLVKEEEMKPWTLVKRTVESFDGGVEREFVRAEVLKPLVLEGVLTPSAEGDMRVRDEERLESIV